MRIVLAAATCFLFAIAGGLPVDAKEPMAEALSARDVLDRMAKAYAECKSYRDSGVVKTVFVGVIFNRTVEKPFRTAFVRPDRFRFEFTEKGAGPDERYLVWQSGEKVRTWWYVKPGVEKDKSLGLALAGATGVSSGSAHTIPALLLPDEVGGRRLTHLTDVKRIADAALDGTECFCIEGEYGDSPMTVWIDKKTFLVRRIEEQTKFDGFRTVETTTYDPVLNGDIPDTLLEFDPPEQK